MSRHAAVISMVAATGLFAATRGAGQHVIIEPNGLQVFNRRPRVPTRDRVRQRHYFRPFSFRTLDPERQSHTVQYVSHPTYTWQELRTERPGDFERRISPAPDPNAWFHVRVVVARPKVSVFVGDAKEPCLVVTQLSDRGKGLVGLWVGNNSDGQLRHRSRLAFSPRS